jgi:CRP/FNR family cyclic AMP-dependent transcriptional regulator
MPPPLPRNSASERARVLDRTWLFHALPPSERERLLGRMPRRRYADGQMIFGRGDPGSSLMLVVEGRVRIGITARDGREVMLDVVEPGELFGELALLDGRPRSADATALGDCVVLSLERRDVLGILRSSPEAAIRLYEIVCGRVRAANDRLESVALLTVEARLARLLLELAHRDSNVGGSRVDRSLTQSDLARLIGSSRQTVNQQLFRWASERIVTRDGTALLIHSRERLLELAET